MLDLILNKFSYLKSVSYFVEFYSERRKTYEKGAFNSRNNSIWY